MIVKEDSRAARMCNLLRPQRYRQTLLACYSKMTVYGGGVGYCTMGTTFTGIHICRMKPLQRPASDNCYMTLKVVDNAIIPIILHICCRTSP